MNIETYWEGTHSNAFIKFILFKLYLIALVPKPENSKVKIYAVNLESSFPLNFPLYVYPVTFITGVLHFSVDIQALEYPLMKSMANIASPLSPSAGTHKMLYSIT